MNHVLVTSRSFSSGDRDLLSELRAAGFEVVFGDITHDPAALAPHLAGALAWIAGTSPVDAKHFDLAPKLRVLARYGVGYEAVDLESARRRGVIVTNTPGANSSAVADHAVGLMLAALRGLADGDRRIRDGDWSARRGHELGTQTVGIVGFGRIGQGVAARVAGFGPRVLAYDPFLDADAAQGLGAHPAILDEILTESTLISLHAPGGEVLIDAAALDRVRPGLTLINTARADLIDEAALAVALMDGRVAAFAADTLAGDLAASASPLLTLDLADRVTITPHLGAQTVEAVDAMGQTAVANVLAVLADLEPPNPVR